MSVASRNPFSALAEDGDNFQAAPAAAKAPAAQAPRNIPGAGQKAPARNPNPRGTSAAKNNRPAGAAEAGADGEAQKDARGNRGGRSSEARGRGARGARAPRGCQFDRHSQTDRVDSQKNLHQGWGGDEPKRELDVEKKAEADAKAENIEANGAPVSGEAEAEEKPVEEEDKTITLDEYLAQQAEKRAALAAPKGRKAAKDDSAWSNFGVQVKKSEGDDYFVAKKDQKAKTKAQKEGKQLLEIEQRFDQLAGGRGGAARGGARGGRGGRGGATAGVNLADKSAFPSLS